MQALVHEVRRFRAVVGPLPGPSVVNDTTHHVVPCPATRQDIEHPGQAEKKQNGTSEMNALILSPRPVAGAEQDRNVRHVQKK